MLCSAGLGKKYINDFTKQRHKYKPQKTIDYYVLTSGDKVNLPIYYRNKVFTEEQREQLWLERLDKHERYVMGIRIPKQDTQEGIEKYGKTLEHAQQLNKELGYGDLSDEWKKEEYNITAKMLNKMQK